MGAVDHSGNGQRLGLVLLVSFALTLPLLVARSQLLTGDSTSYLGLAESLAAGMGIR